VTVSGLPNGLPPSNHHQFNIVGVHAYWVGSGAEIGIEKAVRDSPGGRVERRLMPSRRGSGGEERIASVG
jgi:hypothetical protein